MKYLFTILSGAVVWGVLLYSIIKFLPFGNGIKALIAVLITLCVIVFLHLIDKNLESHD